MSEPVFRAMTTMATMYGIGEKDVEHQPEDKNTGAEVPQEDIEPIENPEAEVLASLGIADDPSVIPSEDRENLDEVSAYLRQLLKAKGQTPTKANYQAALAEIKEVMGIEVGVEPGLALNRMGSVIQAWRNLSFIKDPAEKRSIFMKLAKQEDARSVNRVLLEEMERRQIWL